MVGITKILWGPVDDDTADGRAYAGRGLKADFVSEITVIGMIAGGNSCSKFRSGRLVPSVHRTIRPLPERVPTARWIYFISRSKLKFNRIPYFRLWASPEK